jgi:SAM-dependent methyltransferase
VRLSFTPRRRRGVEWLDDPAIDPAIRERSIGDVVRSNRLFGGLRAAVAEIDATISTLGAGASRARNRVTLLDVGTGLADIAARATGNAQRRGVELLPIGLDVSASLLASARPRLCGAVCGDALALPFGTRSVDVVVASQLLHHFEDTSVRAVVRELDRVARHRVIVSDLRRSWIAAAGFWVMSWLLRFHRVTRHDGVVSVLRGFSARELASLVHDATGAAVVVRRRPGFRLTAVWTPLSPPA